MNNYERWLAELETRVGGIVDTLLDSNGWNEYLHQSILEDQDSINVLIHDWREFGITPENESDVATLLAHRMPHTEVGGNDPGNQRDGYFGYFITIYKNEHYHKKALRSWKTK